MGGEVEHDEGLITQRLIRLDGSGLRDQLSAESEVHGVRKTPKPRQGLSKLRKILKCRVGRLWTVRLWPRVTAGQCDCDRAGGHYDTGTRRLWHYLAFIR
jgi:hypothetical protein